MGSANVREFTDANFEAEVLKSKEPVLVDFWADWCQPCKMLTPAIEAVADQFSGKFKVGKLDTDSNRAVSAQFGITAIPTVMLFKSGTIVKKFVGLAKKEEIAAAMTDVLSR